MKMLKNETGFSLVEILVSILITGILAAAGFEFYVSMHNQVLTQDGLADMQQSSTASLQEIAKSIRQAGYKIGAHPPYYINGDSLYLFYSQTQPVDTILYYLEDYTEAEFSGITSIPQVDRPRKLMKKVNNSAPTIFSDNINDITFEIPDATSLTVTLMVQTMKPSEDNPDNDGYYFYSATENIVIRNIAL
jgi:prepilin-type N-terminal cleavage/methylation domain-containing protein